MFNSPAQLHPSNEDLQSAEVLSVHNTSQGQIAYLRLGDGQTIVVDYDLVNPYSWRSDMRDLERSDNPLRGVVGAPAPTTLTPGSAAQVAA